MNKCLSCTKDTNNPKFCSQSCAAKFNNHKFPKRERTTIKYTNCLQCNNPVHYDHCKFCSLKCQHRYKFISYYIPIIESGQSTNGRQIKQYLEYKFGHKCSICNISDWQNKPLIMILDHIDGNSDNWQISNLRLVCSNCDSQLPTYKSRNKGSGRHYRRERYAKGQSY